MNSICYLEFRTVPKIFHCETTWRWLPAPLDDYDFWAVLGGRGEMVLNDQSYLLAPGSTFMLRPGDRLKAEHDSNMPLQVLAFHFLPSSQFPWDALDLPNFRQVNDLLSLRFYAQQSVHLSVQNHDVVRQQLVAMNLLTLLADKTDRLLPASDERILAVAEQIRCSPAGFKSVAEMSRQVNVSLSHFSREFKRLLGLSPIRYLACMRADRAAELLRETNMSLGEISDSLGYSDVHHFSKQFAREKGEAPGRFRNTWRDKRHE